MECVLAKVGEAVKLFLSKFLGRVITVVYCLRSSPGAIEEARKLGIWLFESMKEKRHSLLSSPSWFCPLPVLSL